MRPHPDDCCCLACVVAWSQQPCRKHPECTGNRNHYGRCYKTIPLEPVPSPQSGNGEST